MSVKIFLPADVFYSKANCDIYGEIRINENNSISYFIISIGGVAGGCSSTDANIERLRHLGYIERAGRVKDNSRGRRHNNDVALIFAYDEETPNIYLLKLGIKPSNAKNANIFLYEKSRMLQLHGCDNDFTRSSGREENSDCGNYRAGTTAEQHNDDIRILCNLLATCKKSPATNSKQKSKDINNEMLWNIFFPLNIITHIFMAIMELKAIAYILGHTVLLEHYQEWKRLYKSRKRNANIAMDKIFGVCLMFVLLIYLAHPGDYLINASHFVIAKLRLLLRALKGSPIGLKLNVHLNNFLLDCFNYHVDLWEKFLDLIEPIVRQLFVPIGLLGCMGLSYQLASLADLITVMGLHAHCFYIYTAVLYKVEINGIQVLWKVMLGKRRNILKNRVESHNYMNRQLYLATIFFTSLLFLFPTIIVYYIVFTTLRLCIYLVNLTLQIFRRYILEFPLVSLFNWFTHQFYEMESIQLQYVEHVPSPLLQPEITHVHMSVFKINVLCSSLGRVFSCENVRILKELSSDEKRSTSSSSLQNIFGRILNGKF